MVAIRGLRGAFMSKRRDFTFMLAFGLVIGAMSLNTAFAGHDDDEDGDGHHHGRGWYKHHHPEYVYEEPRPVIVAPPPVYVVPAPPPVVVPPSVNFVFPLHIK